MGRPKAIVRRDRILHQALILPCKLVSCTTCIEYRTGLLQRIDMFRIDRMSARVLSDIKVIQESLVASAAVRFILLRTESNNVWLYFYNRSTA